jgi:hypothetical protein
VTDDKVLKTLATLAEVLDTPAFTDNITKTQKRLLRETADTMQKAFEKELGPLTPPLLLSFWLGAAAQAGASQTGPLGTIGTLLEPILGKQADTPNVVISTIVAYLARDILAGERVA